MQQAHGAAHAAQDLYVLFIRLFAECKKRTPTVSVHFAFVSSRARVQNSYQSPSKQDSKKILLLSNTTSYRRALLRSTKMDQAERPNHKSLNTKPNPLITEIHLYVLFTTAVSKGFALTLELCRNTGTEHQHFCTYKVSPSSPLHGKKKKKKELKASIPFREQYLMACRLLPASKEKAQLGAVLGVSSNLRFFHTTGWGSNHLLPEKRGL